MKLLPLLLFLAGCATFDTPVQEQYSKHWSTVVWLEVKDIEHHCGKNRLACAYPDTDPCVIVTLKDPSWEILGHEVGHCFKGRWHKE